MHGRFSFILGAFSMVAESVVFDILSRLSDTKSGPRLRITEVHGQI